VAGSLSSACGRLAFDSADEQDVEDMAGMRATTDTSSVQARAALAVEHAPSSTEGHPTLTPDLLELYFISDRGGNDDVWLVTRGDLGEPWSAPVRVAELNTTSTEQTVDLSFDGLTIWIASNRPGGLGSTDLYVATRTALGATWSAPMLVPELSSPGSDEEVALDADSNTIIFHSKRTGGSGGRDLWMSTRTATGHWGAPVPLTEINTPYEAADPFLSSDGLTLLFDSNREDSYRELFQTTRASTNVPFAPPTRLGMADLDSVRADADPWVSFDGRYMVFCTSRTGDDEIYDVWLDAGQLIL
jgi:Tol biopolymer transport system component